VIELDYTHCLRRSVGDVGFDWEELVEPIKAAHEPVFYLLNNPHKWPIGWYHLPEKRPALERCKELAAEINAKADNLLLLGIGGSALGNIALRQSLNPPRANEFAGSLKLHVLDNVDPRVTHGILDRLDPARTYVNVISKSGDTLETMVNLFVTLSHFKKKLFPEEVSRRFIATTEPDRGILRQLARENNWRTLPITPDVGGRFSVLGSVGLLSAAATGVDVDALLDGALDMREACTGSNPAGNPALLLAQVNYKFAVERRLPISVMMSYSEAMYAWACWWRQLWAESLGKKKSADGDELPGPAGTTPLAALGTTDQHSMVQLFMEGPADKLYCIVRQSLWDSSPQQIEVPPAAKSGFGYLDGQAYEAVLNAECDATVGSLADAGRPVYQIILPKLDAYYCGQFIMLWELAVSFLGIMLNVNPFDQPGVEAGKIATRRSLGG
jgi:glucose-6-phosphate isomerase